MTGSEQTKQLESMIVEGKKIATYLLNILHKNTPTYTPRGSCSITISNLTREAFSFYRVRYIVRIFSQICRQTKPDYGSSIHIEWMMGREGWKAKRYQKIRLAVL